MRHMGSGVGRLWSLGAAGVSAGWGGCRRTEEREGEGRRNLRSILSELGSYPRGHRTGLAQGETEQNSYLYRYRLNLNDKKMEKRKER